MKTNNVDLAARSNSACARALLGMSAGVHKLEANRIRIAAQKMDSKTPEIATRYRALALSHELAAARLNSIK